MGADFITIELEVRATFPLDALKVALGKGFSTGFCGELEPRKYFLSGTFYQGRAKTPDAVAARFCKIIEALSPTTKKLWLRAKDRVFDAGLDANSSRRVIIDLYTPETLARMAKLRLRAAVSVYTITLEEQLAERSGTKIEKKRSRTVKRSG